MPISTLQLTGAERLFLYRKRWQKSQAQIARHFDVSTLLYRRWESGDVTPVPFVPLNRIRAGEACVILRRRSGFRQVDLAKRMGICRYWLNLMERGKAPPRTLVEFWAKYKGDAA